MKINWTEAKLEYISDETVSYREIASKYGVNQATVAKRGKRDDWATLRRQLQAEGKQKTIEKVGDSIAEVNARHIESARLLQETGINPIKNKSFKPRSFDQALRSFDKGVEIERKALGMDKPTASPGPSQPNTIINYFDFKKKYAFRQGADQLPSSN